MGNQNSRGRSSSQRAEQQTNQRAIVESRTQERQNPVQPTPVTAPVVPQVRTLPDSEREDRKKRLTTHSDENGSSPTGSGSPKHDGSPIVVTKEHE